MYQCRPIRTLQNKKKKKMHKIIDMNQRKEENVQTQTKKNTCEDFDNNWSIPKPNLCYDEKETKGHNYLIVFLAMIVLGEDGEAYR